jgi:Cation transport ATPase
MKKIFKLKGLDCANCAAKVEKAICSLENVDTATINFFTEKLIIEAKEDKFDELLPNIIKTIKKLEPHAILE